MKKGIVLFVMLLIFAPSISWAQFASLSFTNCIDFIAELDESCDAYLELSNTATIDDPSFSTELIEWAVLVDLWGDGSFDFVYVTENADVDLTQLGPDVNIQYIEPTVSGEGISIVVSESVQSYSNHKVTWYANSDCTHDADCDIEILAVDKTPPTAVFKRLFITEEMPGVDFDGERLELWAYAFVDSGSDNCTTSENLLYSWSNTSYVPNFYLDLFGVGCGLRTMEISVWDETGNNRTYEIEVYISGSHFFPNADCIFLDPHYRVVIKDQNERNICGNDMLVEPIIEESDYMTNWDLEPIYWYTASINCWDNYLLPYWYGIPFQISLLNDNYYLNGVDAYDLFKLGQALNNEEELNKRSFLAADVDSSGSIDMTDIELLSQRLLTDDIQVEGPYNSWNYYLQEYLDSIQLDIPEITQIKEYNHELITGDMNVEGIKIGDLNGDALGDFAAFSLDSFEVKKISMQQRGSDIYDFYMTEEACFQAMQFSLPASTTSYELLESADGLEAMLEYHEYSDSYRVICYSLDPCFVAENNPMFSIQILDPEVFPTLQMHEFFHNSIYADDQRYNLEVDLSSSVESIDPIIEKFSIGPTITNALFHLYIESDRPETSNVRLINSTGLIIDQFDLQIQAGSDSYPVSLPNDVSAGIYFIELSIGGQRYIRRVIKG